jgi:ketosteroid isomerase-like protein
MKYLICLFCLIALISCSPNAEKTPADQPLSKSVGIDSLNGIFVAAWNAKDSAAIMATLASNAIVMNDSLIHSGKEAIAKNWISGGVKVLSNVKTSSTISDQGDKIAYDAGTYSLDLSIPNGPVLKEKGNYSLVWTKQSDGLWLLTMVHIEDVTRLPDVR